MGKRTIFVDLKQEFTKRIIMDVEENETGSSIMQRVADYCKRNGGVETVIDQGGEISITPQQHIKVTPEDSETYEWID